MLVVVLVGQETVEVLQELLRPRHPQHLAALVVKVEQVVLELQILVAAVAVAVITEVATVLGLMVALV